MHQESMKLFDGATAATYVIAYGSPIGYNNIMELRNNKSLQKVAM